MEAYFERTRLEPGLWNLFHAVLSEMDGRYLEWESEQRDRETGSTDNKAKT